MLRRRTSKVFLRVMLMATVTLALVACASQELNEVTPDYSNLDPAAVLDIFLENERSKGTVKFVFSGDIEVKAGGSHHFRGVAGFQSCSALRIKLLGPVGFTLMEYLNTGAEARLIVDEVSPEGDEEARAGLLSLMEIFTLSLLERCQPAADFGLVSQEAFRVEFTALSRTKRVVTYTLDRKNAVLISLTVFGDLDAKTEVAYSDYGRVDGSWMPGRIEIQGQDIPVTIKMQIDQWTLGAELPEGWMN